jgi:hypothetical protein
MLLFVFSGLNDEKISVKAVTGKRQGLSVCVRGNTIDSAGATEMFEE